ncbi:hypothetical protein H2201_002954 [Coniosporium apollinis]|uniref:TOG domain-containing protein n=1 Tax=Coniosporium apollinis TaxID=61459 RepID=A0ABQ9NZT3_9PEZI|nr:hypothetical protein H2201_002954 [Coniosporium apollinis]
MEDQAASLLATLKKPSVAVDAKLTQFNNLKSSIKHLRVPEGAQAPILECIKYALAAQTSSSLVSSGFSTLGHFVKRLHLQDQAGIIVAQGSKLFPILLDRLGDARESHRNAASQSLADLWPICHAEVERTIREGALTGTNARAKEMGMRWVVKMHESEGMPFKSFVPLLVANLEDADGNVRETAKSAVVDLFRNAPDHAKTDLKKQMTRHNVRSSIATYIVSQLGLPGHAEVDLKASTISVSSMPPEHVRLDHGFGDSILSERPPPTEEAPMDPLYVHTQRELEDIFRSMLPHFEGREEEHNWLKRDKAITQLRRLTKGNAPEEFHTAFAAGIKSMQEGILKAANSLRTTFSSNGCLLVQELARTMGPALDPMAEIFLQNFIKVCAATKNIAAQNGNATVDAIFSSVSYSIRLLQHVSFATQDKNVQPRTFASGWLKTLLNKHASHKALIEHSGGVDVAEQCLKKGLADANPKVREGTRSAYWVFARLWPERAHAIMDTLDPKSKQLLEKDPGNPHASLASSQSAAGAGTLGKSVGTGSSRAELREKIAAQKREAQRKEAATQQAAKRLPERPNSAQSTFSPVKPTPARAPSALSMSQRGASSMTSLTAAAARSSVAQASSAPSGSLMAAPVRRPKRPELPRPATADPYASRNMSRRTGAAKPVTPTLSPANSPDKTTGKKSVASQSSAGAPPGRPQSPSLHTVRSKSRLGQSSHQKTASVPAAGPSSLASPDSSPSKYEDLTMVMPFGKTAAQEEPFRVRRPGIDKTMSVDSGIPNMMDGETFSMVIPSMMMPDKARSPRTSPAKATPRRSPLPVHNEDEGPMNGVVYSRSPLLRSVDSAVALDNDEVQVYEDPFTADEPETPAPETEPGKSVLEELPLNERNVERRQSSGSADTAATLSTTSEPARSPRKPASANGEVTHDRAEVLRARRLLTSGIERIKSRSLDAHGFRRLQDLIRNNGDIWGDGSQKFGELLLALLEYLETPTANTGIKPSGTTSKAQNLKAQVLATVRAMLTLHPKESTPYHPRALCAVIAAKGSCDSTSHMAAELEKTADEIIRHGRAAECMDAVLELLDSFPSTSSSGRPSSSSSSLASLGSVADNAALTAGSTTAPAALGALSALLQRSRTASSASVSVLPPTRLTRLARTAARFLGDVAPDVRRAALELCVELHDCCRVNQKNSGDSNSNGEEVGKEFWRALGVGGEEAGEGGVGQGRLNLIAYYLARRGREAVVV